MPEPDPSFPDPAPFPGQTPQPGDPSASERAGGPPPTTTPAKLQPSGSGEAIPLAPDAHPSLIPTARPARSPSLEHLAPLAVDEDEPARADRCPNCGRELPGDAVVCMGCGYDLKANRVVRPEVGVEEIDPDPVKAPAVPEFVRPGGTARVFAIVGGCAALAAMIVAAINAPPGASGWLRFGLALSALYNTVLHTGTGVAALWVVARLHGEVLNKFDLAAARMLVAVAAYHLAVNLRIPLGKPWLELALAWPLAAAAYWLLVFGLFRRGHRETTLILAAHLGVYGFVEFGIFLAAWIRQLAATVPG